jgi:mannose-1-phosphate guanylyltransferase
MQRYAVVMAGGHGTRFWPRSRRRVPKQLLCITGRRTLLQETVRRLVPLCSWRHILVVCSTEHAAEVRRQLPRIPAAHVLVEPVGRNTAACLALAAEWIAARAGDATMIALPADHVIENVAELRRTVRAACALAEQHNCLVTLGVEPTRPETGYGYVEVGTRVDRVGCEAFWVRRFHEKPSPAVARRYATSHRHLWNSGIFIWRVSTLQRALRLCLPRLRDAIGGVWTPGRGAAARIARIYRSLQPISIDVGVMQPISTMPAAPIRVAVFRARFDWNDIGSWVSMPEIWGCDDHGNAALGTTLPIDTSRTIVFSPDRLVALVGVKDVIVIDSHDALLVCARDRAQDVRKVAETLKARRLSRYL